MYIELLQQLSSHTQWSRQSGHTTAMLRGALESKALILVRDSGAAKHIRGLASDLTEGRVNLPPSRFLTIADVAQGLVGIRVPLLIDHSALEALLDGALREMREMVSHDRLAGRGPES